MMRLRCSACVHPCAVFVSICVVKSGIFDSICMPSNLCAESLQVIPLADRPFDLSPGALDVVVRCAVLEVRLILSRFLAEGVVVCWHCEAACRKAIVIDTSSLMSERNVALECELSCRPSMTVQTSRRTARKLSTEKPKLMWFVESRGSGR